MRTISALRPRAGHVFIIGNWRWLVFFLIWGLCLGVVLGGRPESAIWYFSVIYLAATLFVTARKFWRTRAELLFLREFRHLSQTLDDIRALETVNPFDPILATVVRIVGFDRAILLLLDRKDQHLKPVRSIGMIEPLPSPIPPAASDDDCLLWRTLRRGEILMIEPDDPALACEPQLQRMAGDSITVCIPIQRGQQDIGVLLLYRLDNDLPITDDVLLQLQILSDQISISLQNLIMHQELRNKALELELRDSRMNKELQLARLVQEGVLPRAAPEWPRLSISVFFRPARFIGGDYYSYLDACSHDRSSCPRSSCRHCSHETLGLLIGDASGKGIPASLIMAVVTSLFREKAAHVNDPAQLLKEVNLAVKEYLGAETHFHSSAFVGFFSPKMQSLSWANAGHDFPLFYKASTGQIVPLESTGTLLGLFRESIYLNRTLNLEAGDRLLFYTDGLIDYFEHTQGARDGFKALSQFLMENLELSPTDFTGKIQNLVESRLGADMDDITALYVKVDDSDKA